MSSTPRLCYITHSNHSGLCSPERRQVRQQQIITGSTIHAIMISGLNICEKATETKSFNEQTMMMGEIQSMWLRLRGNAPNLDLTNQTSFAVAPLLLNHAMIKTDLVRHHPLMFYKHTRRSLSSDGRASHPISVVL